MNDTHVKVIRFDDENKDEVLMHFGIKDMHWGVRRYQNPDGSLTSLGRIHYGVGEARKKVSNAVKKVSPSEIKRRNKVLADSSKKAKSNNDSDFKDLSGTKAGEKLINDVERHVKVKRIEPNKPYDSEDKEEYSEFMKTVAKEYSKKAYDFVQRNKDPDKWEKAKNDPNYEDFMNMYIEYGDHIDKKYSEERAKKVWDTMGNDVDNFIGNKKSDISKLIITQKNAWANKTPENEKKFREAFNDYALKKAKDLKNGEAYKFIKANPEDWDNFKKHDYNEYAPKIGTFINNFGSFMEFLYEEDIWGDKPFE